MNTTSTWRREPTLIIQAFSAALSIVVALGFKNLSAQQASLIIAVITAAFGVANAIVVRPIAPAAFIAFIGAGAALLSGYGLELSQELVGAVTTAVVAFLALSTRAQVTPVRDPQPTAVEQDPAAPQVR